MVIEAESLWPRLAALTKENAAGEYLTTDMIAAASSGGEPCACVVSKAGPVLSVNTAAQRDEVDHLMRGRAPPRWRARRYRTIREAIRTARADLVDPRKGYGVVRSVLSEVEVTAFQARRGAELESLPSGSSRINNDRMFDYIHRRSHDRVHRTTRIYKFFHNAEADELILYRRVLKIRRALESTWWRDSTYRDISNAQHVFNIVTTYDQDTGMLPRHRDFHGPDTFPLLQCLIPLSAKGVDYEGGDFLLVTAAGDVISAENDLKLRRGDLLLFEKSLEHEIGRTRRGPTGLGRWTLLVGVRAPPREEAS
jgi:hypothetical protein